MYDLIIIGGGPAGITAGIYALRKKLKTLIITKDFIGQTGTTGVVENWPGEKSIGGIYLMEKFKNHLQFYNPEVKEERALFIEKNEKKFLVKTKNEKIFTRAVIVATGRKPKKLDVLGEEDFTGKGVSYCTTCDAPLFSGKKVVVFGGGNAGFEAAIELSEYAREVFLFESFSRFSADEFLQEKAKKKKVKTEKNILLKSIKGKSFVESVVYENSISKKEEEKDVEGVFVQIGSRAITECVKNLVEFDTEGDIKIDLKTNKTKTEGLFAAGDVTEVKDKQIVVAAGEGAKAALSVYSYLKK